MVARLAALTLVAFLFGSPARAQTPGAAVPLPPPPAAASQPSAPAAAPKAPEAKPSMKVGALIQARYELHQDSVDGLPAAGTPVGTDRFYVRRGFANFTYDDGTYGKLFLQGDFSDVEAKLIDAEVYVYVPWTEKRAAVVAGQFRVPFGHDILQNTAELEFAERALATQKLFPGLRDQGIRLQGEVGPVWFAAAAVDGGGLVANNKGYDPSSAKDLVGRVQVRAGKLGAVGASAYYGTGYIPAEPAKTIWIDQDGDGVKDAGETYTTDLGKPSEEGPRERYGADAQLAVDVPGVGPLSVRGELVMGKDVDRATAYDRASLGWHALAVQRIGAFGVGVRYDSYDPDQDKADDATTSIEPALFWQPSKAIRVTGTYTLFDDESPAASDRDVFMVQLQAKL